MQLGQEATAIEVPGRHFHDFEVSFKNYINLNDLEFEFSENGELEMVGRVRLLAGNKQDYLQAKETSLDRSAF